MDKDNINSESGNINVSDHNLSEKVAIPVVKKSQKDMTFTAHLEELRQAIVISAISLALSSGFCFYFYNQILKFLTDPLTQNVKNVQLVFLSPGEAFMATIRVALLMGLIIALPIILNRVYWFVSPGLTKDEKNFSIPIVFFSYILFLTGLTFAYELLLPVGVKFLVEFAPSNIKAMISIGNYISFSTSLLLGTGLIFELPLLLLFLAFIRIVNTKMLKIYRKHALLVSFIVGAIVTPSVDIISQSLLAGALYGLYEISIIIIKALEVSRRKKENL